MVVIDTNSLVRFFTNDDPIKAVLVRRLIEGNEKVYIPDVVFPELEYVLMGGIYKSSRGKVLKAFQFVISKDNLSTSKQMKQAVKLYEKSKLDIADCIIAAYSYRSNLASFDKPLLKVEGLKSYW